MDDLTAFQRDALDVIAGPDEPNGLEIKTELDEYYSQEINQGRLYPNLDTLVNTGLVRKDAHDDRTNAYPLTERGERKVGESLAEVNSNRRSYSMWHQLCSDDQGGRLSQ